MPAPGYRAQVGVPGGVTLPTGPGGASGPGLWNYSGGSPFRHTAFGRDDVNQGATMYPQFRAYVPFRTDIGVSGNAMVPYAPGGADATQGNVSQGDASAAWQEGDLMGSVLARSGIGTSPWNIMGGQGNAPAYQYNPFTGEQEQVPRATAVNPTVLPAEPAGDYLGRALPADNTTAPTYSHWTQDPRYGPSASSMDANRIAGIAAYTGSPNATGNTGDAGHNIFNTGQGSRFTGRIDADGVLTHVPTSYNAAATAMNRAIAGGQNSGAPIRRSTDPSSYQRYNDWIMARTGNNQQVQTNMTQPAAPVVGGTDTNPNQGNGPRVQAAEGFRVPGPPSDEDTVPADLARGEVVIDADTVAAKDAAEGPDWPEQMKAEAEQGFDPDAFLATDVPQNVPQRTISQGFDPDAFLKDAGETAKAVAEVPLPIKKKPLTPAEVVEAGETNRALLGQFMAPFGMEVAGKELPFITPELRNRIDSGDAFALGEAMGEVPPIKIGGTPETLLPPEMTGPYALGSVIKNIFPKNETAQIVGGSLQGVGDAVAGLTAIEMLPVLMAGGPSGRLGQALVAAGFEAEAVSHMDESLKAIEAAPTKPEKAKLWATFVTGLAVPVVAGGAALLKGRAKPTIAEPVVPVEGSKPVVEADMPTVEPKQPERTVSEVEPNKTQAAVETEKPQGQVEPASVPVMITKQMEADLRARGVTDDQIYKMTPSEANEILSQDVRTIPSSPEETTGTIGTEPAPGEVLGARNEPAPLAPEPGAVPEPGRAGVDAAAAEPKVTSIKNEQVDIERATRGLPPAMEPARRDFGTVWDEATKKAESDPTYTERLVSELKDNPRAVTDTENATLLRKQIELQNEFDKAATDLETANGVNDSVKAGDADARLAKLSDDLLVLYDIDKSVGTSTARGLASRKMLAAEDYSLARMITRKRVAKGGTPLTESETASVREQSTKISSLESEIARTELKKHFDELLKVSAEEARQAKAGKRTIGDFLDEQANKARERIKARGARLTTGLDPIDLADHAIIGASYISRGVSKFADWSSKMASDFGEAVRPYLKDLYARAKELHATNARIFADPDATRLIANKKRTTKRIDELQGKIEAGDFVRPEKKPPASDPELDALRFKLSKVKEEYIHGVFSDLLKRRTTGAKIFDTTRETINTSRAIITGLDLSAVLRQGGLIAAAHPIRAAKSLPAMLRAFGSEARAFKVNQEIQSRANAPLYAQAKLFLADQHGASLAKMEEAYMSRWAGHIPFVAGSQRAYTTFLNKLRADSFDAMVKSVGRTGSVTLPEARAIANYINVATGRGTLDVLGKAAVNLNTIFFAPRYVASRFQFLLGTPLLKGSGRTRALVAKEYGRILIGAGLMYALGKQAGADIETDPRSSDFGKLRFGNTRTDPMAGLSQVTVLLSRLGTGQTKTGKNKIQPIRGDKVPFGSGNSADVMARFLRTKLAPVPSGFVDIATGKNVVGAPVTPRSAAQRFVTPLALSDIFDTMREQGIERGTAFGLLSIFGMGLQTYEPKKEKVEGTYLPRSPR